MENHPTRVQNAHKYYEETLKTLNYELAEQHKKRAEFLTTRNTLLELQKKLSHKVMVPLGQHVFTKGTLCDTNKILMLIGDNYFVERSAFQAAEILERRVAVLDENIHQINASKINVENHVKAMRELFSQLQGDYVEIKEEYSEEKEEEFYIARRNRATANACIKKNYTEDQDPKNLMMRLEELEKQEQDNNEKENDVNEPKPVAPTGIEADVYNKLLNKIDDMMVSSSDEENSNVEDLDSDDELASNNGTQNSDKSSVRFAKEIEEGPSSTTNNEERQVTKPILKNKNPTPVDHSRVGEVERGAEPVILPSLDSVFPGKVIEHSFDEILSQPSEPNRRGNSKKVSKFKQMRMADL